MPSLVGIYDAPGPVADCAKRLRGRGFTGLEIYAPAAFPDPPGGSTEASGSGSSASGSRRGGRSCS